MKTSIWAVLVVLSWSCYAERQKTGAEHTVELKAMADRSDLMMRNLEAECKGWGINPPEDLGKYRAAVKEWRAPSVEWMQLRTIPANKAGIIAADLKARLAKAGEHLLIADAKVRGAQKARIAAWKEAHPDQALVMEMEKLEAENRQLRSRIESDMDYTRPSQFGQTPFSSTSFEPDQAAEARKIKEIQARTQQALNRSRMEIDQLESDNRRMQFEMEHKAREADEASRRQQREMENRVRDAEEAARRQRY